MENGGRISARRFLLLIWNRAYFSAPRSLSLAAFTSFFH